MRMLFFLGIAGIAVWWYFGGGRQQVGAHAFQAMATQVAGAHSRNYGDDARAGDSAAMCADAGLAQGSWSLAGNSGRSSQYDARRQSDCRPVNARTSNDLDGSRTRGKDPFAPVVTKGPGFRAP
jgi:hypothetical protein